MINSIVEHTNRVKGIPVELLSASDSTEEYISTAAIQRIVDDLKYQRHRDTMRANYYCVWKLFNKFFIKLDTKPMKWEDRLTLFVGYLVQTKKKSSTVKSYISAIRAILIENNWDLQEDKFLISSLTHACRLRNDQVQMKLPIKKKLLKLLLIQLRNLFASQPYLLKLYTAMFTVAYFGLFRISKITHTASRHAIKATDVFIGHNKDKLKFVLYMSKTHGKGSKPQIVKISSQKVKGNKAPPITCPFRAVNNYLRVCNRKKLTINEQFFVFRDRALVKAAAFTKILKKTIKMAGLNNKLYSSHCFRAGRTLDLMKMGIPFETIKLMGRWKSNTIYAYLKY